MPAEVAPGLFTTRNEALHGAAQVAARRLAEYGITGAVSLPRELKTLRSVYDAVAPGGRGALDGDSLPVVVALRAGVALPVIAAASTLRLHEGLDREVASQVFAFACELLPAVVAARIAGPAAHAAALAAQQRLAGRPLSQGEKDNVRTRALTRVAQEAVKALRRDPGLLDDVAALAATVEDQVRAAVADPDDETWGQSWLDARRRRNGALPATVFSLQESRERRQAEEHLRSCLPAIRRAAQRIAGNPHDGDDLLQEALLHVLHQKDALRAGPRWAGVIHSQLPKSWSEMASEARRAAVTDWTDPRHEAQAGAADAGFPQCGHEAVEGRETARRVFAAAAARVRREGTFADDGPGARVLEALEGIFEQCSAPSPDAAGPVPKSPSWLSWRQLEDDASAGAEAEAEVDRLCDRAELVRHLAAVAAGGGAGGERAARAVALRVLAALTEAARAETEAARVLS